MSDKRWQDLRTSLEIAKTERRKHETAWDSFMMLYSGRPMDGRSAVPDDEVTNRSAFPIVNIMVASGAVKKPKMFAKPRRKEEAGNAKIVEAFLDQWWQKYKVQAQIARADRMAKIIGHGWLKTTWNYREREGRKVNPPPQLVDGMLGEQAAMSPVMDMVVDRPQVVSYLREKLTQVAVDEPVVSAVSPWDVWVDPQSPEFENVRWITHRYFRRPESVRTDERFRRIRSKVVSTAVESNLSGNSPLRTVMPLDGALERVEMWETWDIEEERLYIWSSGNDGLLYDDDWPYAIGHPFDFVPCFELPEMFYPLGVIELIAPKIAEKNSIRSEELSQLRRQRMKYLTRTKYLNADMKTFLESGQEGQVHGIDDERIPLSDLFHAIVPPPINPDLWKMGEGLQQEMYLDTGASEYAQGYATKVRTATEVDAIGSLGTARVQQMVQHVQDAMLGVARKLVGLAQQNLTTGDVVRLVGLEEYAHYLDASPKGFIHGKEIVVPFERQDIAGEFDFALEAGAAQPDNEQVRRQNLLQLAQILLPMPEANREEIIRQMVQTFGFLDVESWIIPPELRTAPPGAPGSPPGAPMGPRPPVPAGAPMSNPGAGNANHTPQARQQMAQAGAAGGRASHSM